MDENVLKELIKYRNILKNKFQSIKMGEHEKISQLERTLKPITTPLNQILKFSNENTPIKIENNNEMVKKRFKRQEEEGENFETKSSKKKYKLEFDSDSPRNEYDENDDEFYYNYNNYNYNKLIKNQINIYT